MIKHSIEINRPAEEVFAYLEQVDRHNEWQGSLVSTTVETDGPTRVGTRVIERRNVPGGTRDFSYQITEYDPPRKTSFRATAVDAVSHGFTVVVPREAVGDRLESAHEANLLDIDLKYGDVMSVDDVVGALSTSATRMSSSC